MKAILSNVRIVDLSMVWAGPYATRLLADLGAEVIKVEAAVRWDGTRGSLASGAGTLPGKDDPGERPYNRAGYFNLMNRNKYGISLDLITPGGKDVFKKLVKVSDVVVESYSPRVMRNFGLDYPVLAGLQPDLIMLSMPGYGSTGPYRDYVAYGTSLEPASGLSSMTGYPDGPPMRSGIAYGDPVAGAHGAFAVLAALRHRRLTGRGQHIDLAQREALIGLIGEEVVAYSATGRAPERAGNANPAMAPHGCYRCKGEDNWVAIAVRTDEDWDKLVGALEGPEWARGEGLRSLDGRLRAVADLSRRIEEWTRARSHHEVMHLLQAAGVPAGAVLSSAEILADPHFQARGFFREITHPEAGTHHYPGLPWHMSETPGLSRPAGTRPAPCFAEHNDYVFRELLGLTEQELDGLEAEGAIAKEPLV